MRQFLALQVRLTPSLQIASQSLLDCSEAAGLVSSMSAKRSVYKGSRPSAAEQSRTVYTELVESLSDLDLGFEIEVGVCKLLALT
jgi:hypothetical protein